MFDLSKAGIAAPIATLILVLMGCVVLHLRLRKWSSLVLVVSAVLLTTFGQIGPALYSNCAAAETADSSLCSTAMNFRSFIELAEPILLVTFGLSFLISARSVARSARRPKSKAPRGPA